MFDLCVKNGKIISSKTVLEGELYVKDGKVAAIAAPGSNLESKNIIDAAGKYLMPGVVDAHVHGGYGTPERETFEAVGKAAAAGGVTTVLEQPLSVPITVTEEAFLGKKKEAEERFCVDFGIWGGLVPGHLEDMEKLYELGAGAFKSFMCRCSNYPTTNDGQILEGLKILAKFGGVHAVHAENDTLIQELADRFRAEGKMDAKAYLESHPPYSELEAIQRYILLSRQIPGAKTHIVHCSIAEGALEVGRAKMDGIDISVETCPQYLALCEDDLYEKGGVAKCDPPVRSLENVEKLWELVKEGAIDLIASDHSPHPFEKKVVPENDFSKAAEGVTGEQTMLPVILTEGVHKRKLPLTKMVQLLCENPARRFGLYGRKGALEIGFDGDFNIIDLDKEWICHGKDMYYVNKHTPYDGKHMKGAVEATYIRGRLVCEQGEMKVEPGFGQFLAMKMRPSI
ncbi:MAG: allantoinase AllB [Lachnospiraceae bacterium]|jgi:allantoinase|nr:allantoinase AllB [Lachnospiraceae bacterium]